MRLLMWQHGIVAVAHHNVDCIVVPGACLMLVMMHQPLFISPGGWIYVIHSLIHSLPSRPLSHCFYVSAQRAIPFMPIRPVSFDLNEHGRSVSSKFSVDCSFVQHNNLICMRGRASMELARHNLHAVPTTGHIDSSLSTFGGVHSAGPQLCTALAQTQAVQQLVCRGQEQSGPCVARGTMASAPYDQYNNRPRTPGCSGDYLCQVVLERRDLLPLASLLVLLLLLGGRAGQRRARLVALRRRGLPRLPAIGLHAKA